jgi:DNA polymerase-3 subunit epsilon
VLAVPLKDGRTGLRCLLEGSTRSRHKLRATGAPFEAKEALKARGYRWDAEARVWWTSLSGLEALEAERVWLRAQVYAGRSAQVQVEEQDSRVLFSQRNGQLRQLTL